MSGEYRSARDHQGDLAIDCDVVVVGSGAGGAVVATELAESGWRVVVLEEGPNVSSKALGQMRPSESIRNVWRDGAMTVTVPLGDSPAINVTMGKCVGGSSVLTGGVCFRIPDLVLASWREDLGLEELTEREMEPFHGHVERTIHVEEVPAEMRSRSTQLFWNGATQIGLAMKPMRRNTKGCEGCGRCNFGCPHEAKLSVDISYLPRAVTAGADVWSHALVERIVVKGGRAVGVRGRLLNGEAGKPGGKLEVRAKRVVVAAGAWHSPVLLMDSGLGNPRLVGKKLTLHPGFRVLARFDTPVRGWQGALQSAWSDSLEHHGITFTGLFVPPGVLGATMPGVGVEHARNAKNIDHLAMFGGILHDEGGGEIHRLPAFLGGGREPVVTYRMSERDRAKIPLLVRTMARAFFAAGAREVYLPVLGLRGVKADDLADVPLETIPASRIECASQHPLGSATMGANAKRGVVDTEGRVWGVAGLHVADGSIVPTSLGVNPQLSIMSLATRVAWRMRERGLEAGLPDR
jgi:choline dehydrogenase-like flavoprotein